jgi:membrane-associated phospholipid phosphatase
MSGPSLRYQAHLRAPSPDPDAGLRGLDHYAKKLPQWRYHLRQRLIPLVRWETPYLARLQSLSRTPLLDSYFALSANLGTHTFFMTFLPICFWCGFPDFGMGLIHMLAAGVYLSGYAKDLVCLPRPLSPPLHRITMSGSAALEYGFPSTHTTNAVSVALSALHGLWRNQESYSPFTYRLLVAACLCYATSISIGRMYCGMHGFLDVIFGAILGAIIAAIRVAYGTAFDDSVISGSLPYLLLVLTILLLAVRFHPEPADNCPCFDDSVAFIGVVMGSTIATWHYSRFLTGEARPEITLEGMYVYSNKDLLKSVGRLIGGILAIFVWRAVMKPLMLGALPPVFRFFNQFGVLIPRRFFLQSKYVLPLQSPLS